MNRRIVIAAIAVVGALAAALWVALGPQADADRFAQCRSGQIAGGKAEIGGPFELVNARGETVTDKDVITGPSLVYFGYTFCPDVCPFDMARNAEAVDILEAQGKIVTPIFISVDPARDTPEVVGDFAEAIHPRAIGLTGSPEQVKAASRAYKTYYKANPPDEDGFYFVDHSTFTYFMSPRYGLLDFFKRDDTPEEMARRVACFMDRM